MLKPGTLLIASLLAASLVSSGCGSTDNSQQKLPPGPTHVDGARVSWGEPAGDPKGVVMLIHGGGWQRDDTGYAEQRSTAPHWQARGYATVAIGYDDGPKGFEQVMAVYKKTRARYPGVPICASGISAGANYSLLLAAREPDLACVVALVPPTDLTTIAAQDPEGQEAYQAAVASLGADQLAKFSPVREANKIKAKVLVIVAEGDPVVPEAQGEEFKKALPATQLVVLPEGPVTAEFAHFGGVQPDAQTEVINREFAFVESAVQGG